jgi:nitrogen fixation/metabolism regulation signal transduction histidine kinase
MSRLVVEFLDQGFHRMLFDAMPMPVFVVDQDVTILEYNTAASQLLAKGRPEWLGRRSGHLLNCVHSEDVPEGCGHGPACLDCVLRQSVRAASKGFRVTRKLTPMELLVKGKPRHLNLRVTCQPFEFERQPLILLILEGLNDALNSNECGCNSCS